MNYETREETTEQEEEETKPQTQNGSFITIIIIKKFIFMIEISYLNLLESGNIGTLNQLQLLDSLGQPVNGYFGVLDNANNLQL